MTLNAAGFSTPGCRYAGMSAFARRTAAAAGFVLLAACASPPPKNQLPQTARPAPDAMPVQNDAAADASYDWHPLLIAPFGTRLVDSPVRLHEVLLFRDRSLGSAEIESRDCYSIDGAPPVFVNQAPEEYLMCFEHDRLERIDGSIRVAADDAARLLARACASWLGNATPLPAMDDACAGRDGDIAFRARLEVLPGERTAVLRMSLTDAARSDAARSDAGREAPGDPTAPPPEAP